MANNSAQEAADKAKADFHARYGNQGGTPILSEKNIKWHVGDEIVGKMVKAPYKMGKSSAADFAIDTETGTEVLTYWVPTILGNLLKKCKEGDMLAIACVGEIPTSNGDAYEFAVSKIKG